MNRKEKQIKVTDIDNTMVVTRGKGGLGIVKRVNYMMKERDLTVGVNRIMHYTR